MPGEDIHVPGDPSSAAFLAAAALIVPGSDMTIEGVLVNPTRTGLYTTLQEMGGDVTFLNEREEGGEPIADIRVRASHLEGRARAGRARAVDDRRVSSARRGRGLCEGETRMDGLAELKVKESDRLQATAAGLAANGVSRRASRAIRLTVEGAGGMQGRRPRRDPSRSPHRDGISDRRARQRRADHCRRYRR